MHRLAPVALATILAAIVPAPLCAQAPTPFTVPQPTGRFTDPANLAGERVRPRNGRELPIDGGIGADGKADNALGLAQMLRKLNTRASLMLIVAHPDDEDGGMLTYYSRGLGARVAVLTLTRGEGGQNQMTGDFEDALGLLRTQELLSADRYMGVDQMFGTEVDFGFTKTKAEAFQKWNHQRVLYDAVRAVRIYRPLVIAAVFSGAVTDGHGQHQVSGEIAQEVFKAAGDPSVFPELTKEGILPWQPLKVYARVPFSRVTPQGLYDYATGQTVPAEFTNYVTGETFTTEPTADVTINEGATDPLLSTCSANPADLPKSFSLLSSREAGSASPSTTAKDCTPLSYVQFARIGLGLQRSQIGAGMRLPRPGRSEVGYHLYGSRVCAPGLANPTPNLCDAKYSTTAANTQQPGWPILSRSERVGYRAAREKTLTPRLMPASLTSSASTPAAAKAPTARSIPAQGNALGARSNDEPRAEGPLYNPALATRNVMLSEGSLKRAAVEEPRESSPNENRSTIFNPELSHAPSFFDGIDTSILGIQNEAHAVPTNFIRRLAGDITSAADNFDPRHPEGIAPTLADALKIDDQLIALTEEWNGNAIQKENLLHELRIKRVQLNNALVLALGLHVTADTDSADIIENTGAKAFLHLTHKADAAVSYQDIRSVNRLGVSLVTPYQMQHPEQDVIADCNLTAEQTETPRSPYFIRHSIEDAVYETGFGLRNAPQAPPDFACYLNFTYRNLNLTAGAVASHDGQPAQVVPAGSIFLSSHAQVLPNSSDAFGLTVTGRPPSLINEDIAWNGLPSSWKLSSAKPSPANGSEQFTIHVPKSAHRPATLNVGFTRADGSIEIEQGFRPVGYGTLPRTNFYTPATLRIVPVDLKLPPEDKRRIAYLPGTGDDVPAALASIGLTPTILKVSDLTPDKLSHFDTVVLGVRTYNAHPDLHGTPTQALLDFARSGGNVVVQYQTPEFTAADAPYPLVDRNERVVDETTPVVLLTTQNSKLKTDSQTQSAEALLTTPNKITSADFNGWIEERGHGFLDSWDPHYTALTETHDPGAPAEHILPQSPQRGGLITVQLGRGRWTYCAFALYRQLPEAVPGAFRLFVNLLNP